jgi:hypothetical protein
MESGQKLRKRDRINVLLKGWKAQPSQQIAKAPTDAPPPANDGEPTKGRYIEAATLRIAVQAPDAKWRIFDFPKLSGEPEEKNYSQVREKLDTMLEQKGGAKDTRGLANCRRIAQCIFTAFGPLAKNFLSIATNVQSV